MENFINEEGELPIGVVSEVLCDKSEEGFISENILITDLPANSIVVASRTLSDNSVFVVAHCDPLLLGPEVNLKDLHE